MSRKRRTAADEPYLIVRSSASNLGSGYVITDHVHDCHQLVFVAGGAVSVWTEGGSWVSPPNWAIWIPAGVRHGLRFIGDCALRTLYIRPHARSDQLGSCGVIAVSALLRELIVRIAAIGMLDERDAGEAALAQVLMDEFRRADVPPFNLPEPSTAPMRGVADLVRKQSSQPLTTVELAASCGMSVRTLERRFAAGTGMPLGRWRQHHGLLQALEELTKGTSIKLAAAKAGYASPSAFISAFRRCFGITPARYFSRS
jgi:AraC-like DNA-binding protein